MGAPTPTTPPTAALELGRYVLFDEIAAGGMASVHFGRLSGPAGFSRVVAIKRLHANLAKDPEFVTMFLEEARLAARIRHLNVVSTLDVVALDGEVFLVLEYVHGQSLANLWRAMRAANRKTDPRIVAAIMSGVLHGLHAAHEAKDERAEPLRIVHRDVSPQNILVGVDGVPRVLDFGVAKAVGRVQTTREGTIKGKLAYMAPEQLDSETLTRRTDVYAAAVVTWELLTGERAFSRPNEGAVIAAILSRSLLAPSKVVAGLPAAFDDVVMRALQRSPHQRYASAREMALDLERCVGVASMSEVAEWVQSGARDELARRAHRMAVIEGAARDAMSSRPPRTPSELPTRPGRALPSPDEASAVSRVALSSTISRLVRQSRKRIAVAASATAASLLGLVLLVRSFAGGKPEAAHPAWPNLATSSAASPVPDLPATIPLAVPAATLPAPMPLSASRPVAGEATDHRPALAPLGSSAVAAPVHTQPKQRRDCDPPFTIDDKGHKSYKAACFK